MLTDLSNKFATLSEDISEISKLISDLSSRLNESLERKNNYVQVIDDLKHLTKDDFEEAEDYLEEPDNVEENEKEFKVTLPYNEENDEFHYFVDKYGDLTVKINGACGNATYATTQTVTVPEDYDADEVDHYFEDGNIVITIPKKKPKKNLFKKHRPTDFNYLHQKRDKKGRFVLMH